MVEARIGPPTQSPARGGAGWSGIKSRLWNNRNDGAIAERMADTDELFDLSKISVEAACQMIQSSALGLTSEEAAARLQTYGLNLVTREKQPTLV